MSLLRRAKQRDASEAGIVAALRAGGASWYQTDEPGDGLLGYLGVTIPIECKNPLGPRGGHRGSKLNDKQAEFAASWRGSYRILRTPEEALALLAEIRRDKAESKRLQIAPTHGVERLQGTREASQDAPGSTISGSAYGEPDAA